jgi:hypothetical protein
MRQFNDEVVEGVAVKVGDMVELSASGRNTQYCRHLRNKTGIVVDVRSKNNYMYPIVVSWLGIGQVALLRSSLKFISRV